MLISRGSEKQLKVNNQGSAIIEGMINPYWKVSLVKNMAKELIHCFDSSNKVKSVESETTVKPVEDDYSWDHSKVVALGRWWSYKTPL